MAPIPALPVVSLMLSAPLREDIERLYISFMEVLIEK